MADVSSLLGKNKTSRPSGQVGGIGKSLEKNNTSDKLQEAHNLNTQKIDDIDKKIQNIQDSDLENEIPSNPEQQQGSINPNNGPISSKLQNTSDSLGGIKDKVDTANIIGDRLKIGKKEGGSLGKISDKLGGVANKLKTGADIASTLENPGDALKNYAHDQTIGKAKKIAAKGAKKIGKKLFQKLGGQVVMQVVRTVGGALALFLAKVGAVGGLFIGGIILLIVIGGVILGTILEPLKDIQTYLFGGGTTLESDLRKACDWNELDRGNMVVIDQYASLGTLTGDANSNIALRRELATEVITSFNSFVQKNETNAIKKQIVAQMVNQLNGDFYDRRENVVALSYLMTGTIMDDYNVENEIIKLIKKLDDPTLNKDNYNEDEDDKEESFWDGINLSYDEVLENIPIYEKGDPLYEDAKDAIYDGANVFYKYAEEGTYNAYFISAWGRVKMTLGIFGGEESIERQQEGAEEELRKRILGLRSYKAMCKSGSPEVFTGMEIRFEDGTYTPTDVPIYYEGTEDGLEDDPCENYKNMHSIFETSASTVNNPNVDAYLMGAIFIQRHGEEMLKTCSQESSIECNDATALDAKLLKDYLDTLDMSREITAKMLSDAYNTGFPGETTLIGEDVLNKQVDVHVCHDPSFKPNPPASAMLPVRHSRAQISYFFKEPKYTNHNGIDITFEVGGAINGTSVYPTLPGTVVKIDTGFADNSLVAGSYGNFVKVDHGNGIASIYAHLKNGSNDDIKIGDVVTTSTVLGQVGNSGNSTGYHLHFEIKKNGTPINPLCYLGNDAYPDRAGMGTKTPCPESEIVSE